MRHTRPFSSLLVAVIFAVVAGGLGWLLFGAAGEPAGRVALLELPRAEETAEARAAHPEVELWRDETGQASLAEVQRVPVGVWRRPSGSGVVRLAPDEAVWLRVIVRNPTERALRGVLVAGDYFLDHAEWWIEEGGEWRSERSGAALAGVERAWPGRDLALALSVPARGERAVYWRVADEASITLRPEWWPDAVPFQRTQMRGLLAEGVYFGGLLALLGYNLVLWVRLRVADIGWYALYLGTVLIFMAIARAQFSELGVAFASPGVETWVAVTAAASGVFLAQFARVFLELRTRVPRGDRVVRGLSVALGVLAVGAGTIAWTDYSMWMRGITLTLVATHATLLVLAGLAWRAGAEQARFFVLSFGCLFAGLAPMVAVWFEADALRGAGMKGLMIGSALEMLLLALAVANRFAQAQRRLVQETEQRRAVEEAYADELEDEVRARTHDLEVANVDKDRMLIALGHDLRSPLSALTKRAEQLRQREDTPGTLETLRSFAGEAAGEGRQMLLLIEDIVLWARLRTGARPLANPFAADRLVRPAVTLHQPLASRRGVELTADVPENLMINTDLVLAQTMVRNLVGNAVKFARSRVEVNVRVADDVKKVSICVRDDGPGLPAVVSARLSGTANGGGGGMGLRLSQEIGEAIGATLAATTLATGGTEICLTLPAHTPASAPALNAASGGAP